MKQAIVIRVDLGMSTGKLAAQACHASVAAAFAARNDDFSRWFAECRQRLCYRPLHLKPFSIYESVAIRYISLTT